MTLSAWSCRTGGEAGYRNATAHQEGIDIYDVLAAFFAQRGQPFEPKN